MTAEETLVRIATRTVDDTSVPDPETGDQETRTVTTGTEAETVGLAEIVTNASAASRLKTTTRVRRALT